MFEVMVIRGGARDAVLEALRAQGYEAIRQDSAYVAWGRRAERCTACCAADRAVRVLQDLHRRAGRQLALHRFVLNAVEKPLIEGTLTRTGGNQVAAARVLGINRNTLRARMRRLGIRTDHGRVQFAHAVPTPGASAQAVKPTVAG